MAAGSQLVFAIGISRARRAKARSVARPRSTAASCCATRCRPSRALVEPLASASRPPAKPGSSSRPDQPVVPRGRPRLHPAPRNRRPRVLVWVSQDTVRADHSGAYGYDRDTSPNFDRLASRLRRSSSARRLAGVLDAAFPRLADDVALPVVPRRDAPLERAPTRATRRCSRPWPRRASRCRRHGQSIRVGRAHLARGFDALVYTGLRADVVSRLARQLVDQWGGGDLALFVHYMDPHAPYNPPEPYQKRFGQPYAGEVNGYNHRSAARTEEDVSTCGTSTTGRSPSPTTRSQACSRPSARRGMLDRALIAYTADHGEELKDHGGWGHAHTLHEELLHVPFALRIPGAGARRVADAGLARGPGADAAGCVRDRGAFVLPGPQPAATGAGRFAAGDPALLRDRARQVVAQGGRARRALQVRRRLWRLGGRDAGAPARGPVRSRGRSRASRRPSRKLPRRSFCASEVEAFLARARAAGTRSTPAAARGRRKKRSCGPSGYVN